MFFYKSYIIRSYFLNIHWWRVWESIPEGSLLEEASNIPVGAMYDFWVQIDLAII